VTGPLGRMHHVGVAVASIEKAVAFYRAAFGYVPQSAPVHDPLQGVSVCFVTGADPEPALVELVEPGAADSPVGRYIAKGIGAYHVCYETAAIEQALEHARQHRCMVVSRPTPAVAFGGRRIAWIYTPTNQLIELLEK
jgi:methylmalonyl-CoA/ethylmalonyl-CoA epimerase